MFDVEAVLEHATLESAEIDSSSFPDAADFGTFVYSDVDLDHDEAVLDLLLDVRDTLRTDPGVNAFLSVDVDVPLAEVDAATQSVEFARASNVVVYVVPQLGDNLGVGIEVGAVLEAVYGDDASADGRETAHEERVLFAHESTVRSAMIAAIRERWEARVYSYESRADLIDQLRLFVRDVARREVSGDLPRLDGGAE